MSRILGPVLGPQVRSVARHPFGFALRTLKAFRAN